MAVFTRVNGTANGVVHVDVAGSVAANLTGIGSIVSTGIGKRPTMYKIVAGVTLQDQTGTGGAVEAILRVVATVATVIAYQVEDNGGGELRVMCEATSWNGVGDYDLQAALRLLTAVGTPTINLNGALVTAVGFKS